MQQNQQRMNIWDVNWFLDEKQCPCDVHFVEWLEEQGQTGKRIYHFGTGGHHYVGIRCAEPEFDCGDGTGSYPASFVCDGIADCGNGVDEADCGFTCNDQSTIDGTWQCDGIPDCLDAEDEAECLVLECAAYLDPAIPVDSHAGCEPSCSMAHAAVNASGTASTTRSYT